MTVASPTQREFHPVADLFPMMGQEEFDSLVRDIGANGLREKISVIEDGRIIDGRNRYKASLAAGVLPQFEVVLFKDDQALLSWVVSKNLHRRHLNEAQRAMVAAKIATGTHGGVRHSDQDQNVDLEKPTVHQAAAMLNVSHTSVSNARQVRANGAKELVAAVEEGKLSLAAARRVSSKPKAEQQEIVERARVVRGRRLVLPGGEEEETTVTESKRPERVRLSVSTTDAMVAATELYEAIDHDFLEAVVTELSELLARARAAVERGMRPARKE